MPSISVCFVSFPIYPLLIGSAEAEFCGGAELQQYVIGRGLADRGHEISFVTLDHGQGADSRIDGFRVLGAFAPRAGLPLLRFLTPRWSGLMHALRSAAADVYILRGAAYQIAPMVIHARRRGGRVLFTGASDTDFDPNARHFRFARDRHLYWWGLKRADAYVAQNMVQSEMARRVLGVTPRIIHNALPEPPQELAAGDEVFWIGNIRPKKRPAHFLELARSHPETRFTMIGGGALGPQEEREHKPAELDNLTLTGYMTPSDVACRLPSAKVLVNTSPVEGFPNTFLQAWARGIPVLTYVDPDGVVAENGLGWVVGSLEEMNAVLGDVLAGRRSLDADQIRDYYRRHGQVGRLLDDYESVLAEMMAASP